MRCSRIGLAHLRRLAPDKFSHGSIYMVGAYIGWLCITYLSTPLPLRSRRRAGCALSAWRSGASAYALADSPRIALLSDHRHRLVLDQVAQLLFTPTARCRQVPDWRIRSAAAPSGARLLIAGSASPARRCSVPALHQARLGGARHRARPRRGMSGVDVDRVNSPCSRCGALGGVSGLLVGMYYNSSAPHGLSGGAQGIVAR